MKKFDFLDFVILILFLLAFYFILTRIFGHSATDISIGFALFSILGSMLYQLNREVGELKANTKFSFKMFKTDMSGLKSDVSVLKSDVSVLKSDVSEIKEDLKVIKRKLR
ncbi:hypothetical protein HYX16_00150 [Candidatus Woesearchaeota archaeon]|nr:hypothetical protein [Candidatus Woesearchaeota archaeon]